ncbi:MAG: hypothetical protein ACOCW4_01010 [bacterium]
MEPEQYQYPASDLHITLLSVISCYRGFGLEQIDGLSLARFEDFKSIPAMQISFGGISASLATVLVCGYPWEMPHVRSAA